MIGRSLAMAASMRPKPKKHLRVVIASLALAGCSSAPALPTAADVGAQATVVVTPATAAPTAPLVVPSATIVATSVPPSAAALPTAAALPALGAGRTAPPPTPTPAPQLTVTQRRQIFTQVWQAVNDNYLYPNFHGLDWPAIRQELEPLAVDAADNDAFYHVMTELVARLDDQHSRFVPPAAVVSEDAFAGGHDTYAGVGVSLVPGVDGGFVQMVFPDSPAASADLRPRDRIIAVDNRPYDAADGDLRGEPGTMVRLSVVRPGAKPRDVVLTRREVQAHVVPYYRRFPGEIGYVWVSTLWGNDMDEQFSGALTELIAAGPLNGLILDLRGNGGGWEHVLSGILSHFARGQVGAFYKRNAVRPLVVSAPAGPDVRGEPLVVLIDQHTASYAEVLAAILQQQAGAKIVGVPSSGNTETIRAYPLPDGSRLWLAEEGFRLPGGASLEGHGVQPDSTVDVNWKHYSEDDDPQLLEALRLLGAGPK